jgi:hypothetical protein
MSLKRSEFHDRVRTSDDIRISRHMRDMVQRRMDEMFFDPMKAREHGPMEPRKRKTQDEDE